jgi:hypothetical protein
MNLQTQRVCAWAGAAAMVIAGIGMFGGGLFPPLAPHASPARVAHFYFQHPTRMRTGILIAFFGFGLWGPWTAAISVQLRRIPNRGPILSYLQLLAGGVGWVFLLGPLLLFAAVAFRATRDLAVLQAMSDIAWIAFIMAATPFVTQALTIGIAVLQDDSATPIFPRWFGYLNLWVALIMVPGGLLLFFKTGVFDWRGLLAFWVPAAAFATWIFVNSWAVDRAVLAQMHEPSPVEPE